MDRLNDLFLLVEVSKDNKIRLDDVMHAYERDPSSPILNKIKDKKDMLISLLGYVREKHFVHEVIEDYIAAPHEEEGNQENDANIADFGNHGQPHRIGIFA
jgi:hypothetical protein